jgi:hypothetical protein
VVSVQIRGKRNREDEFEAWGTILKEVADQRLARTKEFTHSALL